MSLPAVRTRTTVRGESRPTDHTSRGMRSHVDIQRIHAGYQSVFDGIANFGKGAFAVGQAMESRNEKAENIELYNQQQSFMADFYPGYTPIMRTREEVLNPLPWQLW